MCENGIEINLSRVHIALTVAYRTRSPCMRVGTLLKLCHGNYEGRFGKGTLPNYRLELPSEQTGKERRYFSIPVGCIVASINGGM